MRRIFFLIVLVLTALAIHSQTMYIHSIKSIRQTAGDIGYTLDGSMMTNSSRQKLLAPVNFGPTGVYKKKITIVDGYQGSWGLTQVYYLPKESIFFYGNFNELDPTCKAFMQEEVDSLYSWSKAGGKVIVAAGQKAPGFSSAALNANWGFDWQFKSSCNFMATTEGDKSYIFKGPFGAVTNPKQGGNIQGFFSRIPVNSVVLARETGGNPTLVLDCNTLDLWVADIDAFTVAELKTGGPSVSAGSAISNMQDKFFANTITFMDQLQQPPVITGGPGSMTVGAGYNSYQWYRDNAPAGSTGPELKTDLPGDYFVETLVNGGCRVRSNIIRILGPEEPVDTTQTTTPVQNECEVFVPSAFSPDEDGINEELCVYGPCVTEFNLKVYDRWGELVFESKEHEKCWTGRFNGRALDPAVFAWTLKATYNTGETVIKRGNVTLIR